MYGRAIVEKRPFFEKQFIILGQDHLNFFSFLEIYSTEPRPEILFLQISGFEPSEVVHEDSILDAVYKIGVFGFLEINKPNPKHPCHLPYLKAEFTTGLKPFLDDAQGSKHVRRGSSKGLIVLFLKF